MNLSSSISLLLEVWNIQYFFWMFLFYFWEWVCVWERDRDRERVRERAGGEAGGGQRFRESQTGSKLWAVSTEPDVGLELTNCKIMTWAEVGHLTDWATQASLKHAFITLAFSVTVWWDAPFSSLCVATGFFCTNLQNGTVIRLATFSTSPFSGWKTDLSGYWDFHVPARCGVTFLSWGDWMHPMSHCLVSSPVVLWTCWYVSEAQQAFLLSVSASQPATLGNVRLYGRRLPHSSV